MKTLRKTKISSVILMEFQLRVAYCYQELKKIKE